MTAFGRSIIDGPSQGIRSAVLRFAARRGWETIPYSAYAAWGREQLSVDDGHWTVLDPLFTCPAAGGRIVSVRLSRQFGSDNRILNGGIAGALEPRSEPYGLLDDAASSGRTLRHAVRLLAGAGKIVARILLCASSRNAQDFVRASVPKVRWREFLPGDWRVIHLRDGCAHLPFAGRPTDQPSFRAADGSVTDVRVLSSEVLANPWRVLALDSAIRDAMIFARREVERKLTESLGRPARAADLHLLGRHVSAIVDPNTVAGADTLLADLLPPHGPLGT